jgi:hypothetical protein
VFLLLDSLENDTADHKLLISNNSFSHSIQFHSKAEMIKHCLRIAPGCSFHQAPEICILPVHQGKAIPKMKVKEHGFTASTDTWPFILRNASAASPCDENSTKPYPFDLPVVGWHMTFAVTGSTLMNPFPIPSWAGMELNRLGGEGTDLG